MKTRNLMLLSLPLMLLLLSASAFAVQMGGAGDSYPEIVKGTFETTGGVKFYDGMQTTTTSTSSVQVVFDGGGAAIETGEVDVVMPFKCVIQKVYLVADQTGSIAVSVSKSTAWPPSFSAFTGNAAITDSSYSNNVDISGGGWGSTVESGNILRFNIVSCTGIQRCLVTLVVKRI